MCQGSGFSVRHKPGEKGNNVKDSQGYYLELEGISLAMNTGSKGVVGQVEGSWMQS